jgi:hypothetical protein
MHENTIFLVCRKYAFFPCALAQQKRTQSAAEADGKKARKA